MSFIALSSGLDSYTLPHIADTYTSELSVDVSPFGVPVLLGLLLPLLLQLLVVALHEGLAHFLQVDHEHLEVEGAAALPVLLPQLLVHPEEVCIVAEHAR